MITFKISLNTIDSVKAFVNAVNKYNYDIDLRSGRYLVDAKSIMGIFSLDLSAPIIVEAHTENADQLINELQAFITE